MLKSRMERRSSRAAVSLNAMRTRSETEATFPAMLPATVVSCAMSGRTAPRSDPSGAPSTSASCVSTSRFTGTAVREVMIACHSPKRVAAWTKTTGSVGIRIP